MLNTQIAERVQHKVVFVFDWDGTILNSMPSKSDNFVKAFIEVIPDCIGLMSVKDLKSQFLRLSGHPRAYIFSQLMHTIGLDSRVELFARFNLKFEELNMNCLRSAPLFPDALSLLDELTLRKVPIYISSSVPPRELQQVVNETMPFIYRKHISAVLGSHESFSKGFGHINYICKESKVMPEEILVVGDDIADYKLSCDAGVDCIVVDRLGTLNRFEFLKVSTLLQIQENLP